jgi:hypothetical protein
MHGLSTLLQVHELLILPSHRTCRDVMGVESFMKLIPRHLVVCGMSGGVIGPPCTHVSPQLLHGEERLLILYAAQEPKLGLNCTQLVIGFQRLSCLSEEQRVSSREVSIGGRS